ncbi:hypothetical protein JW879_01070 [candidate division WOR-3 bacterium]|nr:hypothetical protein [candidate division WOR-3 bacterium]
MEYINFKYIPNGGIMDKANLRLYLIVLLITTFFWGCSYLPIPGELGTAFSIKERALQTGIDDAKTDIPFLDDFSPDNFAYMTVLSRTLEGSYLLKPGLFEVNCESYCLKPGTYGPSSGGGYIYAPLKGPRAEVIKKILRESVNHPDIEQEDIQLLIWAIIARSKIEDISPKARIAAIKMLTPAEILEINGGALSLIPDDLFDKLLSGFPEPLQKLIETESKIRKLLTKTDATYKEVEKVAVLFGKPEGEPVRDIPEGRWSLHPEGYFVRFFPSGYKRTLLQIYVPERFDIEKDKYNRIIKITDEWGNSVETEYKNSTINNYTSNENKLNVYAFKKIKFRKMVDGFFSYMDFSDLEFSNTGWTLQGNPSGNFNTETNNIQTSNIEERLEWSKELEKQIEKLDKQFEGKAPVSELTDIAMYYQAIKKSIEGHELTEENTWALEHCFLIQKAWQSLLCESETGILREDYVLNELYSELANAAGSSGTTIKVESESTTKRGNDSNKEKRNKKSKDGNKDKKGSDSPNSAPAHNGSQLNGNSDRPVLCSHLKDAINKLQREIDRQKLFIEVVEEHPEAIGLCKTGAEWRNFIDALFNIIASNKGLGPVTSTPFTFITKPSGEIVFITPPDENGNRYELTLMDKNGKENTDNIKLARRFLRDSYGNAYLGDIMFDIFYNHHEKSHLEDYKAGKNKDTPSSAAEAEIKAFKKAIEAKEKVLKRMKERLENKDCIQG